jgi:hypothetical protein
MIRATSNPGRGSGRYFTSSPFLSMKQKKDGAVEDNDQKIFYLNQ